MTPLGVRAFSFVSVAIVAGGIWYYVRISRLNAQIAELEGPQPTAGQAVAEELPGPARESPGTRPVSTAGTANKSAAAGATPEVRTARAPAAVSTAPVVTPESQMQDLVDLMKSGALGNLRWAPPPRNDAVGMVTTLTDVLALSPREADSLRAVIESGKQAIFENILTAATVTRQSDSEYVINVANSPDASLASIRMQNSIKQVLGPGRYDLFDSLGARAAMDTVFANVGLNGGAISVSKVADPARPGVSYNIRRPNGGVGGPREIIVSNLGPLASLLPAEF